MSVCWSFGEGWFITSRFNIFEACKSAENLGSVGGGCRISSDCHHSGLFCRFLQLRERGALWHHFIAFLLLTVELVGDLSMSADGEVEKVSEYDVLYRSCGFAQKLLATDVFQTALGNNRLLRPNKGLERL